MKINCDILLLSPPTRSINHYRPPVALLYLSGYLKKFNYKASIIDITLNQVVRDSSFWQSEAKILKSIETKIINESKKYNPKTIGVTCYSPEFLEVLRLSKKLKKIFPKVPIIIGGIHPTLFPDEFLNLKNTPIDVEVIGEGELTLKELLDVFSTSESPDLSKVQGIAFKKSNKIVKTPLRPLAQDLDQISQPDYDAIDMNYYTQASPYAIRGCFLRSTYILATRGCPSNCSFCVANKLRQFNGGGCYTRMRSPDSLIQEIKYLKREYQIDSFYFIDDLFTINKENVKQFCHQLIKQKIHLLWGCSSKVSTLNEDLIKIMAKSGCIQIDFGIERGSDEALRQINKGISVKMTKEIIALCHRYGIRTFSNYLVNLPEETEKDLNDILQHIKDTRPEIISLNVFAPYPGTEIYQQSGLNFTPEQYEMLNNSQKYMEQYPHLFKFAKHSKDLPSWASENSKKYNKIWPNFLFHLSPRYLKTFIRSKQKLDYFHQFGNLVHELLNQKFN